MKKLFLLLIILSAILFSSCSRYYTPYEAAHKKMRCGDGVR